MRSILFKAALGILLLLGVGAGALAVQVLVLPDRAEVGAVLQQIYTADQDTRINGIDSPVDMVNFMVQDWIRVNKVRRIVDADLLSSAEDYANAARILQHGSQSHDFLTAQQLSLQAYEMGESDMLRHSALAEDRYLVSLGEPQKYGSQFFCEPPNGWQLRPVDAAITDEERLQMDVEPLSAMQAKIDQLNDFTNGQCLLDSETMRQIEVIMQGVP